MIKTLWKYTEGYKKYAFACVFCVVIEAVLEILMPFLMAKIVDVGITNRDTLYFHSLRNIHTQLFGETRF